MQQSADAPADKNIMRVYSKMTRAKVAFSFLILFGQLVAYAESAPVSKPKIGVLLPLSGSYAPVGKDNREGIEAALAESKSPVGFEIVYADSKADPATAVTEFRKLTESDKVIAVFVMRGPVGMAINPLSRSAEMPLLGGVGNKGFAIHNKFAFQMWPKSDDEGAYIAARLKKQLFKTAAVITVQDDWPAAVSDGFRKGFADSDARIVSDHEVNPTETDFRTVLLQIRSKSPQVVFANIGLSQIGPFLRQAREMKLSVPIYSNFWVAKKEVIEAAGVSNIDGVRFVEMDTRRENLSKFTASQFSSTPSGATLSAYTAVLFLQQALSRNPNIQSAKELYAALLQHPEVQTQDGLLRLIDRCVEFPMVEKIMRGGKPEIVEGS